MSNLEAYAKKEMELAGLFDKDGDYGGMLAEAVMKMIKVFADEEHSGASAGMAISIFEKVARFEPLTPLNGKDDEWSEVAPGIFQNRRCSHVFKENNQAYDSNGKVFKDPDGSCWSNRESRVDITFPYMPKTEIVERAQS